MERIEKGSSNDLFLVACEKQRDVMRDVRIAIKGLMGICADKFYLTRVVQDETVATFVFTGVLDSMGRKVSLEARFDIGSATYEESLSLYELDFDNGQNTLFYQLHVAASDSLDHKLEQLRLDAEKRVGNPSDDFAYRSTMSHIIVDEYDGPMMVVEGRDPGLVCADEAWDIVWEAQVLPVICDSRYTYRLFQENFFDPFEHRQMLRALSDPRLN